MRKSITTEEFNELTELLENALIDLEWSIIPFNGQVDGEIEGMSLGTPDFLDELEGYVEFFHEKNEYMNHDKDDQKKLEQLQKNEEASSQYFYSKIFINKLDYEKFRKLLKKSKLDYLLIPNIGVHEAISEAEQTTTLVSDKKNLH